MSVLSWPLRAAAEWARGVENAHGETAKPLAHTPPRVRSLAPLAECGRVERRGSQRLSQPKLLLSRHNQPLLKLQSHRRRVLHSKARPGTARPSEPILIPKLRIWLADFPYLRVTDSAEANNLGDQMRI